MSEARIIHAYTAVLSVNAKVTIAEHVVRSAHVESVKMRLSMQV